MGLNNNERRTYAINLYLQKYIIWAIFLLVKFSLKPLHRHLDLFQQNVYVLQHLQPYQ